MAYWDIGLNHIVDIDGQLLAIDADVIDTVSLLTKARKDASADLYIVRAGEMKRLGAKQLIRLSRDEVLFFETGQWGRHSVPQALAA